MSLNKLIIAYGATKLILDVIILYLLHLIKLKAALLPSNGIWGALNQYGLG
jgi:hypothetical protein